MEFFKRVIDHQEKNKMTLNNVSVVMAPNIFMFKGFRSKITEQQEFSMATSTANIVRLLIRYQNLLWTVRIKKKPKHKEPLSFPTIPVIIIKTEFVSVSTIYVRPSLLGKVIHKRICVTFPWSDGGGWYGV